MQLKVGDKVRLESWGPGKSVLVTAVGKDKFLGIEWAEEESWFFLREHWLPCTEPKKKVLMAPAIVRGGHGGLRLSNELYCSKEDAESNWSGWFHSWPAIPDPKTGMYELEKP